MNYETWLSLIVSIQIWLDIFMAVFSTLIKTLQLPFSLQVDKIFTVAYSKLQKNISIKWTANNTWAVGKTLHNFAKPLPKPHMAGKSTGKVSFQWKWFCFQNADSVNFTWYLLLKTYLCLFLESRNGTESLINIHEKKLTVGNNLTAGDELR